MLVASQLGQADQKSQALALIAESRRLLAAVPTYAYDRWKDADAKAAADVLTHFYTKIVPGDVAREGFQAGAGGVSRGDRFTVCDVMFCDDQGCSNLPEICENSVRLKLTNKLGSYLRMIRSEYKENTLDIVLGPSRMLYYLALTREANDEIRGRAAEWAGAIPMYDVQPIRNERDKWMSWTIEGLIKVALRHPAEYEAVQPVQSSMPDGMPTADTIMKALVSIRQMIDRTTPLTVRADVQHAMRFYTLPHTASDIPHVYSSKERANIYQAATEVFRHVTALPDPIKPPHPWYDPWTNPSEDDIPKPGPYPPVAVATRTSRRVKIAFGLVGGLLALGAAAGLGYHVYKRRQERRMPSETMGW
jgi:hypothetical protein